MRRLGANDLARRNQTLRQDPVLTADGSVTSVGGTGTVEGITLTGTVTTTGSLTLGGTLVVPIAGSGATQVAAGVSAGELWSTSSHATLPDNVVLVGV